LSRWSFVGFTFLLLMMAALSLPLRAQSNAPGTLQGTVVDPKGQAIAGASVAVTGEGKTEVRKVVTNGEGRFTLSGLQDGSYKVEITAPGFALATRSAVQVGGTDSPALSVTLALASVAEEVTVSAEEDTSVASQLSPVKALLDILQHPAIAPALFVGLLYFWLIPAIHTRVMLDANLYELMNWTMAVNGVMFWSLILDSRAKPPARLSHLVRAALILVIELPQMVLGAILSLSTHDFYPVYTICGRVLDMTALNDQHYGGLIIWLPGTLTSFAAMIVVLVTMRLNEEKAEREAA